MEIPPEIRKGLDDALRALAPGISDEKVEETFEKFKDAITRAVRDAQDDAAGNCAKCGHTWNEHDREIRGAGANMKPEYNPNKYVDLYQCQHYMGMGDWCGCEERSRRPAIPENLRR